MINQVVHMRKREAEIAYEALRVVSEHYIAILKGKSIIMPNDFLTQISKAFQFPEPSQNFNSCIDWLRDLDWILQKKISLFVFDNAAFLSGSNTAKEFVNKLFVDIAQWWETDVTKYVVGGESRQFIIYLVD